jgi:hypothetical protein
MNAKKQRGQPAPAPQTPISERLEQVRAFRRVPTLLEFHEKLTAAMPQRPPYEVSYSAIRNYHYDRDPPLEYLRRVADVFEVPLGWLVTGEGSIAGKDAEGTIKFTAEKASREAPLGRLVQGEIPPHVGALFAEVVQRLWLTQAARFSPKYFDEGPQYDDVAEGVAQRLMEPWEKWLGFSPRGADFENYAVAMLSALLTAGTIGIKALGVPPDEKAPE